LLTQAQAILRKLQQLCRTNFRDISETPNGLSLVRQTAAAFRIVSPVNDSSLQGHCVEEIDGWQQDAADLVFTVCRRPNRGRL